MCGLAGVITWDQRHRIDRPTLAKMSACIAHRGPDGQGQLINHDELITSLHPQCALIHRRLAVIDLNDRSLQPFSDGLNKNWLVFNGEIYNYRSLRKELASELPNFQWKTESDTEVLLAAYLAWGEACLQRLNGMFAMAVWNEPTGTLFLARDRMGQKPLFYAAIGADGKAWNHHGAPMAIAFASELGALRQAKWMDATINPSSLADYLRFGYVPTPATIYSGAWKIPPGTWMKINSDGVQMDRYFDPNNSPQESEWTDGDAISRTREYIRRAVKRRLVADVPLGCFLSGGIDSSIVAAAMKASVKKDQPVMTFSIGFEDPLYDETKFAAEVARHLRTKHKQFTVQPNAAEDLPTLAATYGEPFGDSSALPTHYLSRETRQHVTVALSGDGGDELFGGYDRYRAMLIGESVRKLPGPLRGFAGAKLWQMLPGTHPKSKLARLKRLLATLRQSAAVRYESYVRLFDESMVKALLKTKESPEPVLEFSKLFDEQLKDRDVVRAALCTDRLTYLPDDLLTKLDHASMLHALEVRSPFMDQEVVTFAANLTTPQLLQGGGKRILREAFASELPETVFTRPKMGFAVPIGQWLRTDLNSMLRELLFAQNSFSTAHLNIDFIRKLVDEHQDSKVDHSQRLYALVMLELWWRSAQEETIWL
jgi:asparagine synthase (glutamine-hydrolysing)